MTDAPSETFGGFDTAEEQDHTIFIDAFDMHEDTFAKKVAAGITALDRLRALRLAESSSSALAMREAAAKVADEFPGRYAARAIRALPLPPDPRGVAIEAARKALKPFAYAATLHEGLRVESEWNPARDEPWRDDHFPSNAQLTVGDLRRARSALAALDSIKKKSL